MMGLDEEVRHDGRVRLWWETAAKLVSRANVCLLDARKLRGFFLCFLLICSLLPTSVVIFSVKGKGGC